MSIVPRFESELSSVFDSFPRDLWEPFDRFPLFRDFLSSEFGFPRSSSTSVVETPEAHVLKTYAPGVKKEDVKVEAEDGVITVTIPKKEEASTGRRQPQRRTIEISGL